MVTACRGLSDKPTRQQDTTGPPLFARNLFFVGFNCSFKFKVLAWLTVAWLGFLSLLELFGLGRLVMACLACRLACARLGSSEVVGLSHQASLVLACLRLACLRWVCSSCLVLPRLGCASLHCFRLPFVWGKGSGTYFGKGS